MTTKTTTKARAESAMPELSPPTLKAIKAGLKDSLAGRVTARDFSDYAEKSDFVSFTKLGSLTTDADITNELREAQQRMSTAAGVLFAKEGRGIKKRRQHSYELASACSVIEEWITAGEKNGYR